MDGFFKLKWGTYRSKFLIWIHILLTKKIEGFQTLSQCQIKTKSVYHLYMPFFHMYSKQYLHVIIHRFMMAIQALESSVEALFQASFNLQEGPWRSYLGLMVQVNLQGFRPYTLQDFSQVKFSSNHTLP